MRRLPYFLQSAIFAVLFLPLVFLLKIYCPTGSGCIADPFLIIIFSPLLIYNFVVPEGNYTAEIVYLFVFWAIVASLFGYLYGEIKRIKRGAGSTLEETSL